MLNAFVLYSVLPPTSSFLASTRKEVIQGEKTINFEWNATCKIVELSRQKLLPLTVASPLQVLSQIPFDSSCGQKIVCPTKGTFQEAKVKQLLLISSFLVSTKKHQKFISIPKAFNQIFAEHKVSAPDISEAKALMKIRFSSLKTFPKKERKKFSVAFNSWSERKSLKRFISLRFSKKTRCVN